MLRLVNYKVFNLR